MWKAYIMRLMTVLALLDLWSEKYSITSSLSNDSSLSFLHFFSKSSFYPFVNDGSWLILSDCEY